MNSPNTKESRHTPWPNLIGLLVAAAGIGAIALQILHLWQAQAPLMPLDMGARERILSLSEQIEQHSKSVSVPLVQLLVTTERDKRVPLYRDIDLASAAAEKGMNELATLLGPGQDKTALTRLQNDRQHYRELFLAAVDELETNGAKGTLAQFWAPTQEAFHALEMSAKDMSDEARGKLAQLNEAKQRYNNASQNLYAWLAAIILLSASLGALAITCLKPRKTKAQA